MVRAVFIFRCQAVQNSCTLQYKSTRVFRKAGNYARYDIRSPFLHPMLQQVLLHHADNSHHYSTLTVPSGLWTCGRAFPPGATKHSLTEEKAVAQVSESVITDRPCMTGR